MMSSVLSAGPGAADSERSLTRRSIVLCKSALPVSVERRAQQLEVGEDPPLDGATLAGRTARALLTFAPPLNPGLIPAGLAPSSLPDSGVAFPRPLIPERPV